MRILDPLRDVQAAEPAGYCEECGGEVWDGERLYHWGGKRVCRECFTSGVCALAEWHTEEMAALLDIEMENL